MPCEHVRSCRVVLTEDGPLLVPGPVEVTLADGSEAVSRRFVVALCTCRRSAIPPWCDTSHRCGTAARTCGERQEEGRGSP
ncbi:CDGSH iron-sulfur domain-containing protein [Streptomyces sp. NPDC047022]|uniref:CDGSH iron-sulfur domain-containing protein n=1 Tax=Streptomyces sp. NPDC047022 TaxID=3155737 RepID=UPI00340236FE